MNISPPSPNYQSSAAFAIHAINIFVRLWNFTIYFICLIYIYPFQGQRPIYRTVRTKRYFYKEKKNNRSTINKRKRFWSLKGYCIPWFPISQGIFKRSVLLQQSFFLVLGNLHTFCWRSTIFEAHFTYYSCWDLYKPNSQRAMVDSLHGLTWPIDLLKWPFNFTTFFGSLCWIINYVLAKRQKKGNLCWK